MNPERMGWISKGKETAARFIDGRFIIDQLERHELRTMTLLGITGAIAAIASVVAPDPGIKFVATLGMMMRVIVS